MSALNYIRARSGSRDGIALVMVLAFIVLLTILIVSFIAFTRLNRSSTASYSKSIQAQEIAQGGMQDILGDLHAEIVAGSATNTSTYVVGSGSYARAYIPTTNYAAAPAHLGYAPAAWGTDINIPQDSLSPTLIRVSRASQDATATDFFPPLTNAYYDPTLVQKLINRASKANTATPSVNGRYISVARWNKTFLVACSSTTNEANSPYCMPGVFASTNFLTDPNYSGSGLATATPPFTGPSGPPDWVYVTRAGSRVCTASSTELPLLLPSNSLTNSYTVTAGQNPPASPVVGRYAYVMYDEGATLDSSAAGFYSTPATTTVTSSSYAVTNTPYVNVATTQTVMGKSYLPYADLSILSLLQNQGNVNAFVAFRNGSVATPSNSTYLNAAFNYGLKGFLSFQAGDSPMMGRQDLINYFAKADPAFNTDFVNNTGSIPTAVGISRALPYFGTFSRAVSAPSWAPSLDSSSMPGFVTGSSSPVLYRSKMETTGVANRDLPNFRFPNAVTAIKHYSDDATVAPQTYAVNAGDPFLQTRFSLAKISWLSQADPTTGNFSSSSTYNTPIQSCFGLVWGSPGSTSFNTTHSTTTANGGNPCWNYVGSPVGAGGTAKGTAGTIETLDLVAQENREPNFFELLKAAILSGSLGEDPGPAAFVNGTNNSGNNFNGTSNNPPYNAGGSGGNTANQAGGTSFYSHTLGPLTTARAPAAVSDVQIIHIGANIIDQFDADSYPTAIYFDYLQNATEAPFDPVTGTALNPALFGSVDMIYGDENLPGIERMISTWFSTAGNGTTGNSGGPTSTAGWSDYANVTAMACYYVPELWNPHQQPATALTNVPKNFQIRAYGSALSWWGYQGTGLGYAARKAANPALTNTQDASPVTLYFQGSGGNAEVSANGTINFTDTNTGGASALYATPTLLTSDQLSASGFTVSSPQANNMASSFAGTTYPPYYSKIHTVGFCTGISTDFYTDCASYTSGPGQNGTTDIEPSSPPAVTFVLGWLDGATSGTGNFHPYSFINGAFTFGYNVIGSGGGIADYAGSCQPDDETPYPWYVVDPRTSRFGTSGSIFGEISSPTNNYLGTTFFPSPGKKNPAVAYNPDGPGFSPVRGSGNTNGQMYLSDWAVNSATAQTLAGEAASTSVFGGAITVCYYADPDGVVRPGDGFYGNAGTAATPVGDGMQLFTVAGGTTASTGVTTAVGDNGGNGQNGRRPVILNRPFRNVGELGYVFRDMPFKTLDFFSQYSADAALLDVFSVTDEAQFSNNPISGNTQISAVVAGRVDPNNAPVPVLQAILSYGAKKDSDPTYDIMPIKDAKAGAQAIANRLSLPTWAGAGVGPIGSRADLVTQLGPVLKNAFNGTTSADRADKAYLEGPIRALSNVTNARTWNLMIDVIAQSGHLSPTATTLDNFVVEGEKRYWLHVAIDRYTGKIVDQQLEPVYE